MGILGGFYCNAYWNCSILFSKKQICSYSPRKTIRWITKAQRCFTLRRRRVPKSYFFANFIGCCCHCLCSPFLWVPIYISRNQSCQDHYLSNHLLSRPHFSG